jgi:hypothetical protein
MSTVSPAGSIVTLGCKYYHEYDLIVKCLKEIDIVIEVQKVRTTLGVLDEPIDDYLPQVIVELQRSGLIELVRPVHHIHWDIGSSDINLLFKEAPFFYDEVVELLEKEPT